MIGCDTMASFGDLLIFQFPFNIIILLIGLVVVAWYILRSKDESPQFEIEQFKETVYLEHKKILADFGISSDSKLIKGIEPIGDIKKWYRFRGKQSDFKLDKDGRLQAKDEDDKQVDFMIFQIGGGGLFAKILGDNPNYIIIDIKADENKDMKDKKLRYNSQTRTWVLDESVSLTLWGGVYVDGKSAREFVNDISFKKGQEDIMTYIQNYARKVSYIELSQAGTIERLIAKEKLKKSGYDNYKKRILASNKDIEDDEDDED